nr:MAG TPA: hypothetical protein [Caudoviricetes sp.]
MYLLWQPNDQSYIVSLFYHLNLTTTLYQHHYHLRYFRFCTN